MTKTDYIALTLACTLIFTMIILSVESFAASCCAVRDETLRLHIVADSDEEQAQANKLLVRDALLSCYSEVLSAGDAAQAARIAEFLLDDIRITAEKTLRNAGDESNVEASIGRMYFETREYESGVVLPAGEYTALRVVIGEGKGHNWWCVMYPPLCIPVCCEEQALTAEQNIRALQQQSGYEAKFAVVELIESVRERLNTDSGALPEISG